MTVLKCPRCLGETKVLGGTYYYKEIASGTEGTRRRKCIQCGYRYTTIESPIIKITRNIEEIFDFS